MSKYYLTTPIYYVNAAPHIGHTYTTIAADAIKRLKRMQGFEPVILTTGTDEHGQKIERAAAAANKSPQKFTDLISNEFRQQWKTLDLQVDRFQRTTDPKHAKVVQDLFDRCRKSGNIYKSQYTGQYCVSCELYVTDAKPGDPCPDCGRPTETVTEENFYFKLSAYGDRLLKFYDDNPDFIQPESRRNEVIAFVKQGLKDVSISRTTIKWGIPVANEAPHVFYVWFDALSTYMSAVDGEGLWPADLHLIGKEILRFHAVYWPAFLWAADLPLPKRLFAHGWLLFENDKMSKSKGNMVRATPIKEALGADALRYYLLREVVFGQDGNFSTDALVQRYNSDLANGLGNFASRTLALIHQNCGSKIPAPGATNMGEQAKAAIESTLAAYERLEFSKALETIWGFIGVLDRFIVERAPWNLAKSGDTAKLSETLYTAAEALRIVTALVYPVIPESAAKIWAQLGYRTPLDALRTSDLQWGRLAAGQQIEPATGVFPRADTKLMIEKMKEGEAAELLRQQTLMGVVGPAPVGPASRPDGTISIDDFVKVDLRVGEVKSAAAVKGADKLLHLQVDIGEPQPRSIVAGIALAYQPEALVGRKVVIVANLAPRKLRGLESQGMIVAASLEGGNPVLASFLEDVPVGARLK
jgi:methionyl-tRNA synthetase